MTDKCNCTYQLHKISASKIRAQKEQQFTRHTGVSGCNIVLRSVLFGDFWPFPINLLGLCLQYVIDLEGFGPTLAFVFFHPLLLWHIYPGSVLTILSKVSFIPENTICLLSV